MSGDHFPADDAQELARIFGISAMSIGGELEHKVSEWLRKKYNLVWNEGAQHVAQIGPYAADACSPYWQIGEP